ncbi:hypothetical protein J3E69DRAFT_342762 [Trichoderma sp. SZMC 28015]
MTAVEVHPYLLLCLCCIGLYLCKYLLFACSLPELVAVGCTTCSFRLCSVCMYLLHVAASVPLRPASSIKFREIWKIYKAA